MAGAGAPMSASVVVQRAAHVPSYVPSHAPNRVAAHVPIRAPAHAPPHGPAPAHAPLHRPAAAPRNARADSPAIATHPQEDELRRHLQQCKTQQTMAFRIAGALERLHGVLAPRFVTTATTASALMLVLLMWI